MTAAPGPQQPDEVPCRCAQIPEMRPGWHMAHCDNGVGPSVMQGALGPDGDGFRYIRPAAPSVQPDRGTGQGAAR